MKKLISLLIVVLISSQMWATTYSAKVYYGNGMSSYGTAIWVDKSSSSTSGSTEASYTTYTTFYFHATPASGKKFKHWNTKADGTGEIRTGNPNSWSGVGNGTRILYAFFEDDVQDVTVAVDYATGSNNTMGTIGGGITVAANTNVNLTASANSNYYFKGWSTLQDGSSILSNSNVASYQVSASNTTYYAVFAAYKTSSVSPTGSNNTTNWSSAEVPSGYVDLGLPSGKLWAKKNLGGSDNYSVGNYYAWGSLVAKSSSYSNYFTSANYPSYANSKNESWTGDATYDAATAADPDHLDYTPTKADFEELIAHTTNYYDGTNKKYYGVQGYVFEDKNNSSNFIYLSTSTGVADGSYNLGVPNYAHYWTSTLKNGTGTGKIPYYYLGGTSYNTVTYDGGGVENAYGKCYYGMVIRPVRNGVAAKVLTIEVKVGDNVVATHTYRCDNGEKVKITASTPEGYEFVNWKDNNNSVIGTNALQTFTVTGNATYTANFEQNTPEEYTITYMDKNNAPFSGTHESGYPTTHTYGTATTLKTASKTGYLFDGWYTTLDCSGSAVTILGANDYDDDITLYANWRQPKLTVKNFAGGTVTLTAGGNTVTVEPSESDQYYYYASGTNITIRAIASTGYRFTGWGAVTTNPRNEDIEGDMTLSPTFAANVPFGMIETWETATEYDYTNVLTVTLKADEYTNRTFTAGQWATLSVPFNYTLTEADGALYNSVYKFRRVILSQNGESVYIDFVRSNDITANNPYLVVPRQTIDAAVFNGVTLVTPQSIPLSSDGKVSFVSNLLQKTITGNRYFYVGANSNLYYAKSTGTLIKGNRAYFHKEDGAPAPRRVRIMLDGVETEKEIAEDGTIDDVREVRKYMENGRLVIECNGVRMDATGKKIN